MGGTWRRAAERAPLSQAAPWGSRLLLGLAYGDTPNARPPAHDTVRVTHREILACRGSALTRSTASARALCVACCLGRAAVSLSSPAMARAAPTSPDVDIRCRIGPLTRATPEGARRRFTEKASMFGKRGFASRTTRSNKSNIRTNDRTSSTSMQAPATPSIEWCDCVNCAKVRPKKKNEGGGSVTRRPDLLEPY